MHNSRTKSRNIIFVLLGWTLSLGFIYSHMFRPLKPYIGHYQYEVMYREAWAASICWIIYATHQLHSGWILRSVISSKKWQPLSKLCLSTYLIHYTYLYLTHYNLKEVHWLNAWGQTTVYIGDVVISFVIGGIFYLLIEAPTVKALNLFWSQVSKISEYRKSQSLYKNELNKM